MSTEKDIITFYNERGASEKNFDIQNNDFGWSCTLSNESAQLELQLSLGF